MKAEVIKLKRGDLRDALIDYAMDAAEEGHIETMSLRQAARDLGVSSGAVYRHFADKESLLVEIVHLGFMELRELFTTIRPEGDVAKDVKQAVERCREITSVYLKFAIRKPALWHMMFGRIGIICRENKLMNDPELLRYTPFDVCLESLRDYHRLGVLANEPSLSDVRYCWSAVHGAADLAQSGARMDADQIEQVILDTTVRNMRAIGLDVNALPIDSA